MSDVLEGYRMSEVGVIPEDWEVKTFGDVMTGFSSGATPYRGRPEYYKGNIRWITSGELNYNVITDTIEKITENAVRNTNLKIHPKGTFLMAITGLEAEGTRGSCGIVGAEATTNQSCMALFPTKELLMEYLFHYYVNYGNSLALEYCQGTKQQSYTAKIVKILPIIVPPTIEEQQAIASALSDVDVLITALEQLITKKRNIKQGAMQQLLTGEKRLPGFGGEWEVKELKTVVKDFIVPMRDKPKSFKGDIPWCRIEDFDGKYLMGTKSGQYVNDGIVKEMNLKIHPIGTLLVSCSANLGRCAIVKRPLITNQTFIGLVVNELKLSNEFIYYYMTFNAEELNNLSSGTTISYLSREQFEIFKIHIPPTESKQQAIAQILSDMDAEIKSLEQKRNKYKSIKQGMMQELLTGKTRLV